ncbi:MAG: hypothetical protein HOY78_34475 [Saccharothrix sp.]|nr:hypothetical protein [Saccharothrix sp.]
MGRRLRSGAVAVLVVLAGLAAVFTYLLGPEQAGAALLGALGWVVALAARVPAVASAGRLHDPDRGRTVLAAASAVTDEVVRLLLVLVAVTGFAPALWAGLGWAVAELVFATATGLSQFTGTLRPRAAELLGAEGGVAATHPLHVLLRGATTTAFHLGATLLLVDGPWWLPATVAAHAVVNLAFTRWARHRLPAAELGCAVVGALLLAAGLAVSG